MLLDLLTMAKCSTAQPADQAVQINDVGQGSLVAVKAWRTDTASMWTVRMMRTISQQPTSSSVLPVARAIIEDVRPVLPPGEGMWSALAAPLPAGQRPALLLDVCAAALCTGALLEATAGSSLVSN